jgi:hypothetical protein
VVTSLCEPWREFIEAQLRLKRNATAIFQDLVDQHGFAGQYNSVKRFVSKLRKTQPEQFDRVQTGMPRGVEPSCAGQQHRVVASGGKTQAQGDRRKDVAVLRSGDQGDPHWPHPATGVGLGWRA